MPLPPVNPPSGFSTSLLQNNQFYPSYHSYLGFKELNKQVFPLLEFIDGTEIINFPYTLTPPDGTDYVIIQSTDPVLGRNLILSHSNTSLGGLIIPQGTIFSLMTPAPLSLEPYQMVMREFLTTKGDHIIETIIKKALDPTDKDQAAMLKMCADRLLPGPTTGNPSALSLGAPPQAKQLQISLRRAPSKVRCPHLGAHRAK